MVFKITAVKSSDCDGPFDECSANKSAVLQPFDECSEVQNKVFKKKTFMDLFFPRKKEGADEDDARSNTNERDDDNICEREFHDTVATIDDDDESQVERLFGDRVLTSNINCLRTGANKQATTCHQSMCAPHLTKDADKPIMVREGDGIDYVFELVESAFCGEYSVSKMRRGAKARPSKEELPVPVYEYLTRTNSLADSVRSSRSGNSRRRRRSRTPMRKSKSKRKEVSTNEAAIAKAAVEKSAAAFAFIQRNLSQATEDTGKSFDEPMAFDEVIDQANKSEPDVLQDHQVTSAFEGRSAKVIPSDTTALTANTSQGGTIEGMRDLCVLSTSSVSSFDDHNDAWTTEKKKPWLENPLNHLIENPKKFIGDSKKVIGIVTAFLSTLAANVQLADATASHLLPVNKGLCFIACMIILLCWPENMENERRPVEKKEPPKKRGSLLTLVTKR
jgi:hypothetical protein